MSIGFKKFKTVFVIEVRRAVATVRGGEGFTRVTGSVARRAGVSPRSEC